MQTIEEKKEYDRKWVQNNPDKVRASQKRYYEKTKHLRVKVRSESRRQRKVEMSGRKQSSSCEVCGQVCKTHYDHDHKSGKFRGWLCIQCNTALGLLKDNPARLDALRQYVIAHWYRYEIESQNYKLVLNDKRKVLQVLSPPV